MTPAESPPSSIAHERRCPIRTPSHQQWSSGCWRHGGDIRGGGRASCWWCCDARSPRVSGRSRVRSVTSCAATAWSGRRGGGGAARRMPSDWPSMPPPMRSGVRISKGTSRSARIAVIPSRSWTASVATYFGATGYHGRSVRRSSGPSSRRSENLGYRRRFGQTTDRRFRRSRREVCRGWPSGGFRLGIRPGTHSAGASRSEWPPRADAQYLESRDGARPPRSSLRAQQRSFDAFRQEYNHERPHEALVVRDAGVALSTVATAVSSSGAASRIPPHFRVERVYPNGVIRSATRSGTSATASPRNSCGLEEVDDNRWTVYFGPIELGVLDVRSAKARGMRNFGLLIRADGGITRRRRRRAR